MSFSQKLGLTPPTTKQFTQTQEKQTKTFSNEELYDMIISQQKTIEYLQSNINALTERIDQFNEVASDYYMKKNSRRFLDMKYPDDYKGPKLY